MSEVGQLLARRSPSGVGGSYRPTEKLQSKKSGRRKYAVKSSNTEGLGIIRSRGLSTLAVPHRKDHASAHIPEEMHFRGQNTLENVDVIPTTAEIMPRAVAIGIFLRRQWFERRH